MEDKRIPTDGTPAHQAFMFQGEAAPGTPPSRYVGVDEWFQPDKTIGVGQLLAQFDHRPPAFIQAQTATTSEFFTQAQLVMRVLTDGKVSAQQYAEAVQVGPFRPPTAPVTAEHTYPGCVAIYRVTRPIEVGDWELSKPADYGQATALNNIHFGEGAAPQVFLKKRREELLKSEAPGEEPTLVLAAIIPCFDTHHRLGWLKELEQQGKDNDQITAAIPQIYKQLVDKLLQGTAQEQQRGQTMLHLQQANKEAKAAGLLSPAATPSLPTQKPTASVDAPKVEPQPIARARRKGPHH